MKLDNIEIILFFIEEYSLNCVADIVWITM